MLVMEYMVHAMHVIECMMLVMEYMVHDACNARNGVHDYSNPHQTHVFPSQPPLATHLLRH